MALAGLARVLPVWWLAAGLHAQTPHTFPAQSTRPKDLAAGVILAASRDLLDPNFAQTVVLLVHYDQEGVVGLVLNRRTNVPLSRVFSEWKEAKGKSDPVYQGGPVGRTGVLALLRSRARPDEAEHVFGDVHLISNKTLLEKTLAAGTDSSAFHVYLGYAGWTVRQLTREVELGAWFIFPGDAATVFDPHPDSLWTRLIRKTEERIARAAPLAGGMP